jgi:hypothetical protein
VREVHVFAQMGARSRASFAGEVRRMMAQRVLPLPAGRTLPALPHHPAPEPGVGDAAARDRAAGPRPLSPCPVSGSSPINVETVLEQEGRAGPPSSPGARTGRFPVYRDAPPGFTSQAAAWDPDPDPDPDGEGARYGRS